MFLSNNGPSFHLWWKENLVKDREVSKYYETDCRSLLGFSYLSEHKFRQNFADSLNPLCSCVLETESTSHFFLRCQNYTTLRRALMTDLKNINDVITSLNENDLRHVILYGNKNFDSNINISILTATIKFIKVSERFDQLLI